MWVLTEIRPFPLLQTLGFLAMRMAITEHGLSGRQGKLFYCHSPIHTDMHDLLPR